MASAVVLEQHMAGMAPACDDLCRATSEDLVRQPISSDDLETATPERDHDDYARRHTGESSESSGADGDASPSSSGASDAQPRAALAQDVEGILRSHLQAWGKKLVALQPKVHMSEHLVECGMALFKYLRQLQVEAAYEGRFPADYLSSEHLLMHDLAACFWIGLKHCSVRTAVPNRTLLCRATGASAELLCDREVAALVAMDWGVNALLRSAGLVQ